MDKSVIFTRSFCPSCQKTIKWFDNIPLISFLLLKRKCRNCDYKISFQYFIVELITAISFTIIYYFYGISITSLLLIILSVFFVIIFFIDLKHFIIPNSLTFPLMFIGFIKSFDPNLDNFLFPNYINSLIGGVIGYLIIWLIIFVYKKVRNKEGMGLGDAKSNSKTLESAVEELALISGQKPITTLAKKDISNFKIRKGWPVGCKVTLRSNKMYEFLERLIAIALPRTRDFRGLSFKSFDGRGNYNFGIKEQIIFTEIDYDKIQSIRGMNITISTSAKTDDEAYELLKMFGLPLREKPAKKESIEAA